MLRRKAAKIACVHVQSAQFAEGRRALECLKSAPESCRLAGHVLHMGNLCMCKRRR